MATEEDTQVLTKLQSIDNYDFEHFVADLWARQGWDTEVSQASVDAGIDVIATKEQPYPQKMLIQVKRYGPNTTVGGPDIQQYASLKHQRDNVDSVIVVTSSKFTRHAKERAQELNVKTVDGHGLVELLNRMNSYDLLDKYDTPSIEDTPSVEDSTIHENHPNDTSESSDELFLASIPNSVYYRCIQVGTAVWTFGLLLGLIGYSGSGGTLDATVGVLAIVMWVAMPPALYYEGKRVGRGTDWTPYKTLYAVAAAVPFLNALSGGIYLFRRKRAYDRRQPQRVDESSSIDVESADESREPISERTE
jgi:restriction system protein